MLANIVKFPTLAFFHALSQHAVLASRLLLWDPEETEMLRTLSDHLSTGVLIDRLDSLCSQRVITQQATLDMQVSSLSSSSSSSKSPSSSPPFSSLLPSFSSSQSSSSSPLPTLPLALPPADAVAVSDDEITMTSVHEFASYSDMTEYVKRYAAARGFEPRWHGITGGEQATEHRGVAVCWCRRKPPAPNSLALLDATQPAAPATCTEQTVTRRGQCDCACVWSVRWCRRQRDNGTRVYTFTEKRALLHTGHTVHAAVSSGSGGVIDSLRDAPAALIDLISALIRSGITGEQKLRRFVQLLLGYTVEDSTFHNLLNRTKRQYGVAEKSNEMGELLQWLLEATEARKGVADFDMSSDEFFHVARVCYMSADMVYNLDRNGCVLIMDTTHKTNRFGWPLLLVCGINEHFQTVLLAVAILEHEDTASFAWVLRRMRAAVSEEAWNGIACVATDGDAAMRGAIDQQLPHAHQLRCWYHLEQNLRANVTAVLGAELFDAFLQEWKAAALHETEEQHRTARAQLHEHFPAAVTYLERCIWPNEELFVQCFTRRWCTLGILSTQRVEGMNAKLKGMLHVTSNTPLKTLFDTLEYAASDIDRAAQEQMRRLDEQEAKTAYRDTFAAAVHPHISRYAQRKVQEQFERVHNYRVERELVDGAFVYSVRHTGSADSQRVVRVTLSTMDCSCSFPTVHLLPCRHVLRLNMELFDRAFQPAQVGPRWLRAYKPPGAYRLRLRGAASSSASSSTGSSAGSAPTQPSFLPAVIRAAKHPAQQRREQQLRELCDDIVEEGSKDADGFFRLTAKLREVLGGIRADASARRQSAAAATPAVSDSSTTSATVEEEKQPSRALTSLNPSVSIEEATAHPPPMPPRKRHREQQKRYTSRGERPSGRRAVSARGRNTDS